MLSKEDFYLVGSKTQLVSIDLLIEYDNKYLFGKRINNPARGYYFVPGSIVKYDEKIHDAMKRITKQEISVELPLERFDFCTVTQHWYENNFRDDKYGTHYLNLSYIAKLTDREYCNVSLKDQHSDVKWFSLEEIFENKEIHENSKLAFRDLSKMEL